ncbi:ABC-F family ATP-binding cassette domain-containing protein [Prosthecochloris sp. N3]|uniref:ABC-F family ATP-binding cassette domain-containing protein n=1 Tax=Prosthecochloris ethylica TaxID=2743976 RepID=A0ABR9XQH8_9CHLB|nr:ABC-F family ATP-binding cassette domain-containing protein [Prosthecochloris ethylica]MBF0585448.1 ABC-F family ATP-binding cassette domain-containing protein [Prosthecochloris ethylica]MBF0636234.1 ABC-F family ATP-binding cassette domain-containing protein [Prosthecochloris ethylica]NUK46678.1 ABC-F family ATP-binding cassette domain-containing protein [Prosthecochloris ethylica]
MVLLTVEAVSKQYGLKTLFHDVSFGIDEKDKVGIIGVNGCGKSTLLKIIAGVETPDSGKVMRTRGKRISWLPQESSFDPRDTVLDAVLKSGDPVLKLVYEYELACRRLEQGGTSGELIERVSRLSHELDTHGAWELEATVKAVLGRLGLHDVAATMNTLSGGQRKRVALAHALVNPGDALVLDEPTNHLDADSVEWLEAYLRRYQGALVLVTHDRYFLDRVVNRMVELDGGTAELYRGSYAEYLGQKASREAEEARAERKKQALINQELEWLRSGCKARTTKQKARIQRAEGLMQQGGQQEKRQLDTGFGAERLGSKIIEFHQVSKSWDDMTLIENFTYHLQKGDRIGLIGPNGSGKTTLLEMIAGRVKPDSGHIEIGQTVRIGYYDQMSRGLDDEMRVIDYIREESEQVKLNDGSMLSATKMLERFLFSSSEQYQLIGNLSGGERRRLYLLKQLMTSPNVLLLDEPTNDLDIMTLQVLEDFLDSWDGCVITVSHDRYFLDRVVDHVFAFEEGGEVREYPGNYTVYLEFKARREAELKEAERSSSGSASVRGASGSGKSRQKLGYRERRELSRLEERIAEAEERQAALSAELNAAGSDFEKVRDLSAELQDLQAQLDDDMARWAELAELAEG